MARPVLKKRRRLSALPLKGHIAAGWYRPKLAQSGQPTAARRSVSATARRIAAAWAAQSGRRQAAPVEAERTAVALAVDFATDQSFSVAAPGALRIGPAQRWVSARAAADMSARAERQLAKSACFA